MNITSSLTQHCHARTGASFWPRPYPGESHEHFAVRISRRYRDTPEAFLLHRIDWQIMGHNTFRSAKIAIGFLLRVWATFHFYEQHMKVISLVPQKKLITSGPYRFSRNPLYLGGNVFIFFAADSIPWIDNWNFSHRCKHPLCGNLDSTRGKTTGTRLWRGMGTLQKSGAPMVLSVFQAMDRTPMIILRSA
jgi:Phospholipid methyltransferase